MESPSNSCESFFEVALERRAAGLSVRDERELEAHLLSCSACRAYAKTVERMQAMIQTGNTAIETGGSWRRANAYIARKERRRARMLRFELPLGIGIGVVLVGFGLLNSRESLATFGAGWILASLITIGRHYYSAHKLSAVASSSDDILGIARKELNRRFVVTISGMLVAAAFAVVYLVNALESPPSWFPAMWHGGGRWLSLALGLCFVITILVVGAETLPRLRRERRKLE